MQPTLFGASEERRLDLSQWYTPPRLAEQIVEWARIDPISDRVLEPAAGRGALIAPILDEWGAAAMPCEARVVAYDVDPTNVAVLKSLRWTGLEVRARDFLADPDPGSFDVAVMNPPYENDQDIDFILRALALAPRVVVLVQTKIDHGVDRFERFWRFVDPVRKAKLRRRPRFGGSGSPKGDFVVYEFRPRDLARQPGEPIECEVEWW